MKIIIFQKHFKKHEIKVEFFQTRIYIDCLVYIIIYYIVFFVNRSF